MKGLFRHLTLPKFFIRHPTLRAKNARHPTFKICLTLDIQLQKDITKVIPGRHSKLCFQVDTQNCNIFVLDTRHWPPFKCPKNAHNSWNFVHTWPRVWDSMFWPQKKSKWYKHDKNSHLCGRISKSPRGVIAATFFLITAKIDRFSPITANLHNLIVASCKT